MPDTQVEHPKFHQPVSTPNGPGIVQGRVRMDDGTIRIMVTHKPDEYTGSGLDPEKKYAWVLREYKPEDLKEPEKKKA